MAITDVEVITRARTLIQDDAYGVHPAPRRYSDEQMQGFLRQTLSYMVQLRPDIFTVTCHFLFGIDAVQGRVTTAQRLPAPAVRLVEMLYEPSTSSDDILVPGVVFEEVDWDVYTRASPHWVSGARFYAALMNPDPVVPAPVPARYVRHPRNPLSFFIWPASELVSTYLDVVVSPHRLSAFSDSSPQKIYVAKCEDFGNLSGGAMQRRGQLSLGGPDTLDLRDEEIDEYYLLPDAYLGALVDGVVYLAESVDNEHVNSGRAKLFYDSFVNQLGVDMQNREQTDVSDAGVRVPRPGVAVGGTQ